MPECTRNAFVTTQTWIPNIVVVEDYGEIPGEAYDVAVCNCGYESSDYDAVLAHAMAHVSR